MRLAYCDPSAGLRGDIRELLQPIELSSLIVDPLLDNWRELGTLAKHVCQPPSSGRGRDLSTLPTCSWR